MAGKKDIDLLFKWSNDKAVRDNSYSRQAIEYNSHVEWFNKKINSNSCVIYIFLDKFSIPVGQVRIEKDMITKEGTIGIIVESHNRGKGYSSIMLEKASADFLNLNSNFIILAYVMKKNKISYKSFIKAGYKLLREEVYKNIPSYILYKNKN